TLAGLGDPPLPENAIIDSAVLRVAHKGGGTSEPPTVIVQAGPTSCTQTLANGLTQITDERIDLKKAACGIDTASELRALTTRFNVALRLGDLGASFELDGIWLEVVSREAAGGAIPPPAIVRQPSQATSTSFLPADRAKRIGEGLTADATIASASASATPSAALVVDNFVVGTPLAPGSRITSAQLRVAHQEDANIESVGVTATVPEGPCPVTPLTNSLGALRTDLVPLSLCVTRPDQLAGLAVTYTANRKTPGSTGPEVRQVPTKAESTEFLPPDNARVADGTSAVAALSPLKRMASVTLTNFTQPPVPPGAIIDSAKLRIAHRDDGAVAPPTVQVKFAGSDPTKPCASTTLSVRPNAISEDTFENLQGCITDTTKLADLIVTYTSALTDDGTLGTDFLDGVALDISFRPPAVDKLDGIELDLVVEAPSLRPNTATGELLTVSPGTTPTDMPTRFVAGGTIYAPSAAVNISMNDVNSQVLKRGVVARSVRLGLKPKDGYKRPSGVIPPEIVTFTAYPDEPLRPNEAGPAPPATPTGFDFPDKAKIVNGISAEAPLDATRRTASLELSGFSVPPGTAVDFATLRVRHRDDGNTVKVTVTLGDRSCTADLVPRPGPEDQDDLVDLAADCRIDSPEELATVKVIYEVELAPSATLGTAFLDGIELLPRPMVRADVTFDRAKATVERWSVLR
ncbi:MAG: hypothetical protein WKF86_05355, partial [Acidimicrobiales bacterium]